MPTECLCSVANDGFHLTLDHRFVPLRRLRNPPAPPPAGVLVLPYRGCVLQEGGGGILEERRVRLQTLLVRHERESAATARSGKAGVHTCER